MKIIYILLTRSTTLLSRVIGAVTGAEYTHASIAFDSRLDTLCSFTRLRPGRALPAGLAGESLTAGYLGRHGNMACMLLAVYVSETCYLEAQSIVTDMLARSDKLRYSVRGLIQCRRGVIEKRKDYFFCSQFVAEVLQRSEAVVLPKPPSLMQPIDYLAIRQLQPCFCGTIHCLAGHLRGAGRVPPPPALHRPA